MNLKEVRSKLTDRAVNTVVAMSQKVVEFREKADASEARRDFYNMQKYSAKSEFTRCVLMDGPEMVVGVLGGKEAKRRVVEMAGVDVHSDHIQEFPGLYSNEEMWWKRG